MRWIDGATAHIGHKQGLKVESLSLYDAIGTERNDKYTRQSAYMNMKRTAYIYAMA